MSLFGTLSIGSQAILTSRKAVDITNENISNQDSEGYSRQTPVIQDLVPVGVSITKIKRIFDNTLYNRYINLNQQVSGNNTYVDILSEVETFFNDIHGTGLSESINSFFNSFNDVAIDPKDPAARETVISQARQLISKIRDTYSNMKQIKEDLKVGMDEDIQKVNNILSSIAKLNKNIKIFHNDETRLNNYLDQRDKLLKDLSTYLDIKVVFRKDDTVDIYTVKGHSLVLYDKAKTLSAEATNTGVKVRVDSIDLTSDFQNGSIGGKLRALDVINKKISDLNDFTALFAASVNKIHRQGYDLNGNTGRDFFKISPDSSLKYIDASNIDLNITDYTQIAAASDSNYLNSDNSVIKSLIALEDYNEITTKTSITGVSPSTTFGNGSFDLYLDNQKIATINYSATDTISNIANTINSSQSRVVAKVYTDSSGNEHLQLFAKDINLSPSIELKNDTGSFVSSIGGLNSYKGLFNPEEKTDLTSSSGLNIGGTIFKVSDKANLDLLGNTSFQELYNKKFVAELGLKISDAKDKLSSDTILRDSLDQKIKEKSAVNLDEELANLVKYQRAYQSAAKIIAVTDELIQTVLGLVG
ncbi:flagellar hook-associated protein FlgK [Hydrogenothermus marinus]|uniref:Flagellar hook-associated protein 1 n=1 Tax=Hydrogenothermus marinus TaxID=133270 RepID=A0A3M0C3G8_9AQUI|nr:flagellar hook-associated protein FlgK [Hydrogenothermus marinus]RMA97512.1 flagellar hook-associated protein FlgK [Hydrogenothermus marinus]